MNHQTRKQNESSTNDDALSGDTTNKRRWQEAALLTDYEENPELRSEPDDGSSGGADGRVPMVNSLSKDLRQKLVDEFVDIVASAMRNRAQEVLDCPNEYGNNLNEIRCQICGAVADYLHYDHGDEIERLLEDAVDQVAASRTS